MGKIKEFLLSKKGIIIAVCAAAVILIAIGILIAVILGKKGYRSIAVEDVKGNVNVVGEKNNGQAYIGERLYSGDDVSVLSESELTLCMDNDKYLYAGENTHFVIESVSSKKESRIKILLDQGSELNELTQKLGINDTYDVDTPNATMSVRGTVFRVTVYYGDDGFVYTLVEVTEGVVNVKLKTTDGVYNGTEKDLHAGESALIRANEEISEFVTFKDGETILMLDYDSLPKDGNARVEALIKKSIEDNHVHSFGEWKIVKDATCGEDGEKKRVCECGEEETETVKATGEHTWEEVIDSDPTCAEDGHKHQECSVCGAKQSDEIIEATGKHSWGNWTTVKNPTCTEEGSEKRVCSVCQKEETRTVAKLEHNWGDWGNNTASCENGGTMTRVCRDCEASESMSTGPLGHKWVRTGNINIVAQGSMMSPPGPDIEDHEEKCSECGKTQWVTVIIY